MLTGKPRSGGEQIPLPSGRGSMSAKTSPIAQGAKPFIPTKSVRRIQFRASSEFQIFLFKAAGAMGVQFRFGCMPSPMVQPTCSR